MATASPRPLTKAYPLGLLPAIGQNKTSPANPSAPPSTVRMIQASVWTAQPLLCLPMTDWLANGSSQAPYNSSMAGLCAGPKERSGTVRRAIGRTMPPWRPPPRPATRSGGTPPDPGSSLGAQQRSHRHSSVRAPPDRFKRSRGGASGSLCEALAGTPASRRRQIRPPRQDQRAWRLGPKGEGKSTPSPGPQPGDTRSRLSPTQRGSLQSGKRNHRRPSLLRPRAKAPPVPEGQAPASRSCRSVPTVAGHGVSHPARPSCDSADEFRRALGGFSGSPANPPRASAPLPQSGRSRQPYPSAPADRTGPQDPRLAVSHDCVKIVPCGNNLPETCDRMALSTPGWTGQRMGGGVAPSLSAALPPAWKCRGCRRVPDFAPRRCPVRPLLAPDRRVRIAGAVHVAAD